MARVNNTVVAGNYRTVARRDVAPGSLFKKIVEGGRTGEKVYAALGHNGKLFSINTKNGELASTAKGDGKAVIVGGFTIDVNLTPKSGWRKTTRNAVRDNEVFKVVGQDMDERKTYLGMGRLTNGKFVSVDLDKPYGEDYSVTNEGGKAVYVVGTWALNAKLAA